MKSFVAVQTGCDHRCTFCSIWQARGPSRSLPFEAIRDAVAREIDRGAKEIVLTGVDITDYAGGLGNCASACSLPSRRLQRLRLSSLDSIEIDDALFELIAGEPRLMPHFHLSLQAGDDMSPEAHEAPPQPRRRCAQRRADQGGAGRRDHRRRPHRRISHRN